MSRPRLEALRDGIAPLLIYPLLALLSFPTFGQLIAGDEGLAYAHDVFDLPRSGVLADWLTHGPQLWSTHVAGGNALLAQQAISPYAVDVWVAFVLGPFAAYAVSAWLLAAVAGLSMHLFLRDSLRLPTVAVLLGAIVYASSFWHVTYGFVVPAMPLLLWLTDHAFASGPGRWRFALALTLVGALLLYHGQSQIVLLAAALQLGWILVSAGAWRQELPSRLAVWLLTWLAAFALFAPVFLTQLVMLPISQRTVWDLDFLYDARPIEALRSIIQSYSATLFGAPLGGGWGASPAVYGTYFLGAVGLVLTSIGIVAGKRDRRTGFILALLVLIPMIDLVAVLMTPIQERSGLLRSFQFVRVRHLYPFVLVVTASVGLEALIDGIRDRAEGRFTLARRKVFFVGATAIPLAITIVVVAGQVLARRRGLRELETEALGWALVLLALAIGFALVAIFALAIVRGRPSILRSGGALLLSLVALTGERALYAHGERYIGERELGTWQASLGETSGQEFMLSQPDVATERVLTFGDHANRMGALDLLQADGYQAIYPLTYHRFFGALTAPYLAQNQAIATYFGSWGNRAYAFGPDVDPELVALAGVRWLYVVGEDTPTVAGIEQRFRDGDVRVFEVPDVLPRAFIADRVAIEPTETAVVGALARASLDELHDVAWLVDGPEAQAMQAGLVAEPSGPPGSATIIEYTPDRVEVAVRTERPGVLVLTDVMAPGWVAERDGSPVGIATADGAFRAVAVEPATRRVRFRYEPTFTYQGFGIAITTFIASILWALWKRRRDSLGLRRDRMTT